MSLAEKRLFLLDMDGTIYLSETLFDGSLKIIRKNWKELNIEDGMCL